VRHLVYDAQRNRVTGVRVIDAETKVEREYTAASSFLCASALESARILLNSRHRQLEWAGRPQHHGSHQVGRGERGDRGWTDRRVIGNAPNGIYVPRFRNVTDRHPTSFGATGFQGGAGLAAGRTPCTPQASGRLQGPPARARALDDELRGVRARCCRARRTARTRTRRAGTPGHPVACTSSARWSDNELAIHGDMKRRGGGAARGAGAKNIEPSASGPSTPGGTNHEMGTARMGRDAKTSVFDRWNQTWAFPNVFVTTGRR